MSPALNSGVLGFYWHERRIQRVKEELPQIAGRAKETGMMRSSRRSHMLFTGNSAASSLQPVVHSRDLGGLASTANSSSIS